jgi:cytidylate kinase
LGSSFGIEPNWPGTVRMAYSILGYGAAPLFARALHVPSFERSILPEMSDKRIIIAIDGPAGSGKSTLARRIAERLGFVYINTGAMYRTVALWALRNKTDLQDVHRLEMLAQEAQIEFGVPDGRIFLNGEDVTEAIRTPAISMAASKVSAVPGVRRALVPLQRSIAEKYSVVMEGRDIGTVIFPEAQVKIFLDAHPHERARRRALELKENAKAEEIDVVADAIRERDERDRTRQESPLMQAPDAQLIDTTGLSLEEVEEIILRLVRSRTSNGKEVSR